MKIMILLLSILCSACTTKTVVKLKYIDIPPKYLVGCHDPEFNPPQEAIDKAKAGDYKYFSIEQAKHSTTQSKEIESCNKNIEDLKSYQEGIKNDD